MSARRLLAAAVVAVTSVSTSALADFRTGNDLYTECSVGTDDAQWWRQMLCDGYVMGIADANNGITVCESDGMTVGQFVEVVKRYLAAHPESRHRRASDLVSTALAEVFPCRR